MTGLYPLQSNHTQPHPIILDVTRSTVDGSTKSTNEVLALLANAFGDKPLPENINAAVKAMEASAENLKKAIIEHQQLESPSMADEEKEDENKDEEPPATALTSTQSSHVITDEFILWVDQVDRESQIEVLAEIVIAKIVPVTNAHANNGGR